ncbi:hypothetical protein HerbRD11066_08860 [Herbidospora sp. RD11066]
MFEEGCVSDRRHPDLGVSHPASADTHDVGIYYGCVGAVREPNSTLTYPQAEALIGRTHAAHTGYVGGQQPGLIRVGRAQHLCDRSYLIYSKVPGLDIPSAYTLTLGPPPASEAQDSIHFDRVCQRFPALRVRMIHGADLWWHT